MSGKKSKGPKGPSASAADLQSDEGMQAVVLCDAFGQGMQPLTLDTPLALLPVAGIPLIEYTLESLALQGVTEILLFAARFPADLRAYLNSPACRWAKHMDAKPAAAADATAAAPASAPGSTGSPASKLYPRICVVTSSAVGSAGEALRCLDDMAVLRDATFLLLDGLGVTNVKLDAAIAAHNARAAADSNVTLTAVCVPTGFTPPTGSGASGSGSDEAGVGTPRWPSNASRSEYTSMTWDPVEGRIWSFEVGSTAAAGGKPPALPAPASVKGASSDIRGRLQGRTDLLLTGIYVCSPNVIIHFSDNYDYTDIRRHYMKHEVRNVDMGWRFSAHIAAGAYACPVTDPRALLTASADVAAHRVLPFAPGSSWSAALSAMPRMWRCPRPGVYVQDGAVIEAAATITGPGTIICAGAVIEAGARVHSSVVCSGSRVCCGATVTDSILAADVVVGAGGTATAAVLGAGVTIAPGVHVPRGCVLGSGVQLGPGASLAACTRLSCVQHDDGFGAGKPPRLTPASAAGNASAVVGAGGCGRLWPAEGELDDGSGGGDDDDDDDEEDDEGEAAAEAARTPAAVAAVVDALAAAVRAYAALVRGGGGGDAAALERAHAEVGAAAAAAVRCAAVVGAAGLHELDLALPLLPTAPALQVPATAASSSTAGGAGAGAGGGAGAGAVGGTAAAFSKGVTELVLPAGPRPTNLNNLALEVKSFKYAENRSFADCVHVLVPLVLDYLPAVAGGGPGGGPLPLSAAIKAASELIGHWAPLLAKFAVAPEDEYAVVAATQAWVCAPAHRADWFPLFGVLLKLWYDEDATTDTAVSSWAAEAEEAAEAAEAAEAGEAAAGGDAKDKIALWKSKWVQQLLESLDDEEEEEDDEEEGDDDEEEEEEEEAE